MADGKLVLVSVQVDGTLAAFHVAGMQTGVAETPASVLGNGGMLSVASRVKMEEVAAGKHVLVLEMQMAELHYLTQASPTWQEEGEVGMEAHSCFFYDPEVQVWLQHKPFP